MSDNPFGVLFVRAADLDFFVKPSRTNQRIGEDIQVVGSGDYKNIGVSDIVNSLLNGNIFFCVAVGLVFVGEFVHII
jgi:hypothetical protein